MVESPYSARLPEPNPVLKDCLDRLTEFIVSAPDDQCRRARLEYVRSTMRQVLAGRDGEQVARNLGRNGPCTFEIFFPTEDLFGQVVGSMDDRAAAWWAFKRRIPFENCFAWMKLERTTIGNTYRVMMAVWL